MTVYRAYYGDALYGQNSYGLSGSIVDASASISSNLTSSFSFVNVVSFQATDTSTSTTTSSAEIVKLGASAPSLSASVTCDATRARNCSASVNPSVTVSSAAQIVKDADISASLQNAVTTVAEKYAETDGYRDGYGKRTYGTFFYGENYSVEDASASISPSASVSIDYERVRLQSASINTAVSISANAVIDIVGEATINPSATVSISYNRVRLFEASEDVTLTRDVSARYKWLSATDPTTTWTEADYLERAA